MGRRARAAGLTVGVLAAFGLTVWGLKATWEAAGGAALTLHGWIAMALGFGFTALLAGALMGLAFYSARRGWDDTDRDP